MIPRPKLDFSTILTLWRPELALDLIRQVKSVKGEVKPRHFRTALPTSSTEAEKYTAELLRRMCEYAFGDTSFMDIPARKRIWTANSAWLKYNVPIGKGATFEELAHIVERYSQHLREDNAQ